MTSVADGIRANVGRNSKNLVAAYFDPANRFAGATFETLPPNNPKEFTASDLLGASLLDVPFLPRAVRPLLGPENEKYNDVLATVPADVDLWDARDEQLAPAYALWEALKVPKLEGVGPTRRSKLMARKRPRLIPVVDSVVRGALGITRHDDSWLLIRDALCENGNALVMEIEKMRPEGLTDQVSTLRILDAAIWMNCSNSKHVKRFRVT